MLRVNDFFWAADTGSGNEYVGKNEEKSKTCPTAEP